MELRKVLLSDFKIWIQMIFKLSKLKKIILKYYKIYKELPLPQKIVRPIEDEDCIGPTMGQRSRSTKVVVMDRCPKSTYQ